MSLRRLNRTIREDDSDEDAVALKPGAGPVKSMPQKISIQSRDEEDEDENIDHDRDGNEGQKQVQVQNPPAEGNGKTQVTSGVPVTAGTPSDAYNADNSGGKLATLEVELTPEDASVQVTTNPDFSPAGPMAARDGTKSAQHKGGNIYSARSRAEKGRREEGLNTDQKSIAVVDLTVEDGDEHSDTRRKSVGGELEDSEVEWDDGSTSTETTRNVCKSRWPRSGSSKCVVPESKPKGKGKASNEGATSLRRECESFSSIPSKAGRGRSKGSSDVRSSSSSPEVVRRTKSRRRIVSSDIDDDDDDGNGDEFTIPSKGKKWEPRSGPSTRLRTSTTTYTCRTRSGRPRRATASNAINYALLHEGQPLQDDSDDERDDEDDRRRVSEGTRRSRSERRAKSKKRRSWFPEDYDDDENDEWLEVIEDGHEESASKIREKRNKNEDYGEDGHQRERDYEEEGVSHAELFHRQMMEDDQSDPDDPSISSLLSPAHTEDVHELFSLYLEFIGRAVQGSGKGPEFMKRFDRNRQKFGKYRRAIKKFEDHICTVRESIAGGGSWNQEFKSAVMTYPFVGFGFPMLEADDISNPEPCSACHRKERANMSVMYLAGNVYDSRQIWMRSRWDELLPHGWENPSAVTTARTVIREWLPMGATCRDKSHVYHTLLHYKLYLACRIRHKMNEECITPEMLKSPRFQDFRSLEKGGFDEMLGRAEWMVRMKTEVPNFNSEQVLKAIRRQAAEAALRMWQYVPKAVVEKAEAKLRRNIDPTEEGDQSDASYSTEKDEQTVPPETKSRGAKRGRYGHAFSSSRSSDSEDPNDMSGFIVDG